MSGGRGAASGADPGGPRPLAIATSDRDFERVRSYLEQLTGVTIGASKKSFVEARLAKRIRALGFRSCGDYLDLVSGPRGAAELDEFVNALTTHKTDFYRESQHFELLERDWLPGLADRRRRRGGELRVWCAACSTGEEAWSLAMLLATCHAPLRGLPVKILATDVAPGVLRVAQRGEYPTAALRSLPPRFREFLEVRRESDGGRRIRVVGPPRAMVRFHRMNLVAIPYPVRRAVDLVFLRNALIYFAPETRFHVLREIVRHIVPSGMLVLGLSESLLGMELELGLVRVGEAAYRRVE